MGGWVCYRERRELTGVAVVSYPPEVLVDVLLFSEASDSSEISADLDA